MGEQKKNIRARENEMKKNHARQLTLKKYSCYGKKNSNKEFDNEKKKKNSCGSKIPLPTPPYNFSNCPSLVFALLCLFLFTFFKWAVSSATKFANSSALNYAANQLQTEGQELE